MLLCEGPAFQVFSINIGHTIIYMNRKSTLVSLLWCLKIYYFLHNICMDHTHHVVKCYIDFFYGFDDNFI